MKTKYDIEITINDVTNKGKMEVSDDNLNFLIDDKSKSIYFKDIKNNTLSKEFMKITLNDNTCIMIKTIGLEIDTIYSFIELQRSQDESYGIKFKSKSDYNKKHYSISLFVIFFVIWFLSGFETEHILLYFICSMIFAIPAMFILTANSDEKDRATSTCPNCHKEMKLQSNIGGVVSSVFENEVGKITCNSCGNVIGMKYNHLYKITPENEKCFENKVTNPIIKENNSTPTTNNVDDIEKLKQLKDLLDKNVITQEDFDKKKNDILNKL